MGEREFSLVILGAGPGGYVAAIRAAQQGFKVAVVERDAVGGTCLNWGCIPTKALVASTDVLAKVRAAKDYGVIVGEARADLPAMMARQRSVVERLKKGVSFLFKRHGITLLEGTGRFTSPATVEVTSPDGSVETLRAGKFLIATGSRPVVFPVFGYDGNRVITSNEALRLEEIPERLLVIGGGVIGCEFASIFAELGSQVTIVEMMPSILPMLDADVARTMASYLKRRGVTIHTKAKADKVEKGEGGVTVTLESGTEITADKVLVSIGRAANTDGLDLASAGVEVSQRGEIPVNESMQTNVPHIYACGDVTTGKYKLAHVASHEGLTAVAHMRGRDARMHYGNVPSCVFTRPEAAGVGLTEEEAKLAGLVVTTGKFLFMANGKALSAGESEGFVKVVVAENDRLLGVHIVGPHASDLIAEAALALECKLTSNELGHVIHAHPTLAEAIMEAAEAARGQAIHG